MTTTSSSRRASSASVEKKVATSDASAIAETNTGYLERLREIGKTISESMQKLSDIDWKRESPSIAEAENQLNETMALYCDDKVGKSAVKAAYKDWVSAHRGGLL